MHVVENFAVEDLISHECVEAFNVIFFHGLPGSINAVITPRFF